MLSILSSFSEEMHMHTPLASWVIASIWLAQKDYINYNPTVVDLRGLGGIAPFLPTSRITKDFMYWYKMD